MTAQLNTYANIYDEIANSTISSSIWIEKIKSNEFIELIFEARQYKKQYVQAINPVIKKAYKKEYDKIKSKIPTVTWNAFFNDKRSNVNFVSGTGFLFIDIDDIDFDINMLDKSKIFACWVSVGGLGYSVIVRVDGINLKNYISTYTSIIDDLNITNFIDLGARKITQNTILSYDPDIYVNDNPLVYSTVEPNSITKNSFCTDLPIIIQKKKEHNGTIGTKQQIRYSNINDFEFNEEHYVENWNEGLNLVECNQPFKPLQDGRKRYMINYIRNYVWLNPNASLFQIINSALFVNISVGIEPLPKNIIEKQVQSILKQKNEKKLTPKVTIRRIIFNPKSLLSPIEKQKLRAERQSVFYKGASIGKIYDVIEDWNFSFNGKITIRNVAEAAGLANSTVSSYWYEVKQYVNDLNAEGVNLIKEYRTAKSRVNKDRKESNVGQLLAAMDVNTITEQSMIDHPDVVVENITDEDLMFF